MSPPPPPYRRGRGGDADQPSRGRSSRSSQRSRPYRPARRAAFISDPPPPVRLFRDRPLCPPSPRPSYAAVLRRGIGTPPQLLHEQESRPASDSPPGINFSTTPENQDPVSCPSGSPPFMDMDHADVSRDQHSLLSPPLDASIVAHDLHAPPQHQEESGSGSELDSPPRLTYESESEEGPDYPTSPSGSPLPTKVNPAGPPHIAIQSESESEDQELDCLTSPPGSPLPIEVNPEGSLKDSPKDEEDPYFDYLVDKFSTAAEDVCGSALSDDDIDYKARDLERSVLYAESALKHYNNDEKNKIKYELISGVTACDMLIREGCFSHVNFTAKGNQQNAEEELFFAELRRDKDTLVPTSVVSLHGIKKVGGLRESKYDKLCLRGLPIDAQHCYACDRDLKHPKNGKLYKIGHVAMSVHYI